MIMLLYVCYIYKKATVCFKKSKNNFITEKEIGYRCALSASYQRQISHHW